MGCVLEISLMQTRIFSLVYTLPHTHTYKCMQPAWCRVGGVCVCEREREMYKKRKNEKGKMREERDAVIES